MIDGYGQFRNCGIEDWLNHIESRESRLKPIVCPLRPVVFRTLDVNDHEATVRTQFSVPERQNYRWLATNKDVVCERKREKEIIEVGIVLNT